jgi:RHH-type proline utilization regulon transcriptional repressor/proline dehydrogenase/delta 1-pyrroline-5-carboxylate dehydrogenase
MTESVVQATPAEARADDRELITRTEALAERLLTDAISRRGWRERFQERRIARLLNDDDGLAFVLALTDEVLRIRDRARAAAHFQRLVSDGQAPQFLGRLDRTLLRMGAAAATRFPRIVMPLVQARVRAELASFVVAAEPRPFARHVARRRAAGIRLNINPLGEAVLGEDEAERRLEAVLALLRRPDIDYVSVKVSSVCSQLNIVAFDHEVERVAGRLRRLYDEALLHQPHKFVNLDMEEYSDLDLTVAVFKRVLSEDRYAQLPAGIVLQAYIPDSDPVLVDLLAWARDRHRRHGSAVKIRLVKGANLAMEQVEAELASWTQAPFATKAEVDANYKRMLDVLLDPANAGALRVGVGTHNLFEAAWALTVAADRGLGGMLEMEMLEGMAPSIAESVRWQAGDLLLYAPIARRADSESVIAYLVRRFDENTGPENFLRHQFSLQPGTRTWERERDRFRDAVRDRHAPAQRTRRTQDRSREAAAGERADGDGPDPRFDNEPDTDVSVAANREWLAAQLKDLDAHGVQVVPAVLAGRTVTDGELADGRDPADPECVAYRWVQADETQVDEAVAAARAAGERWRARSLEDRRQALRAVAHRLVAARGRLIGIMAREAGKTVAESDPEVSEATDFARYYAARIPELAAREGDGARFEPFGTVVVVPPWNFPLAIPAGGVLAALAAGNAVILKPAPETVATAWALAQACWEAGIPQDALQFLPTTDGDVGRRLIEHPGVDAVILTGSWDTARMFLGWRPDLRLHAETSGKNAIVITAAADLDGAVADLVHSAFGHAGQKCSAASLAIVEASVYNDERFRRQLADAVRSLRVGPGWDLSTTMGPLIRTPEDPLDDALHRLGPGESWLVEPHQQGENPRLWTAGIKLGVRPGSPFHLTECFGPVLGLMCAADLGQAIEWQNQPAYGLTAGLQSLDPAEIERWREAVQAGNLYVNRHITGAIVRRQSFGGWKRSVMGPGPKAGGPNYVASLGTWTARFDGTVHEFAAAVARAWREDLVSVDESGLLAEANVFRYRPLRTALLRAGDGVSDQEISLALAAASAVDVAVSVSSPVERDLERALTVTVEDEAALIARIGGVSADKLRLIGAADEKLRLAVHDAGLWLDDVPVVAQPTRELLRWVREQAVSETRHRHGNITGRHPGPPVAGAAGNRAPRRTGFQRSQTEHQEPPVSRGLRGPIQAAGRETAGSSESSGSLLF